MRKCLLFLLLLTIPVLLKAQQRRITKQALENYKQALDSFVQQKYIPSISFAILHNQKLVYSAAIGFADVENKVPATDTTVYSIASLTKPVAATLILKLQEQHKLNIDSTLRTCWKGYEEYFSTLQREYPEHYAELKQYVEHYNFKDSSITIRHHLSHTAEGKPGRQFRYNGFLFGVLSKVVDNVVPENFSGLMDSCIFKKLRFQNSFLQYSDIVGSGRIKNLAKPYTHGRDSDSLIRKQFPEPNNLNAGAGLICSVQDLAKFDIAFDRNELISAKTTALMLTPAESTSGKLFPYALGWFIGAYHGKRIVYHYGLQETYSSFYLKIPGENISLIILANSNDLTAGYQAEITKGNFEAMPYLKGFLRLFAGK